MSSNFREEIKTGMPQKRGLYDPVFEKDSCGVGFVAHIKGEPSHQIVLDADHILQRMVHRGGCGCEPTTGDGAGILTGIPHDFLVKVARQSLSKDLPEKGRYAAGNVFLPTEAKERAYCKQIVDQIILEQGQKLIGWRDLPVDAVGADVGPTARNSQPYMEQLFIAAADNVEGDDFERQLYIIRKRCTHLLRGNSELLQSHLFYICSLSTKVIIYKGMLTALQVKDFYPDLKDEDYKTHLAMVHSRFSTNTFPSWDRNARYAQSLFHRDGYVRPAPQYERRGDCAVPVSLGTCRAGIRSGTVPDPRTLPGLVELRVHCA